jgi:hypothetical protein
MADPNQQPMLTPQNCFQKMVPADLIALVVIIGGLTLISLHIDGIIGGLLVSVTAYYFGKQGRPPEAAA